MDEHTLVIGYQEVRPMQTLGVYLGRFLPWFFLLGVTLGMCFIMNLMGQKLVDLETRVHMIEFQLSRGF